MTARQTSEVAAKAVMDALLHLEADRGANEIPAALGGMFAALNILLEEHLGAAGAVLLLEQAMKDLKKAVPCDWPPGASVH